MVERIDYFLTSSPTRRWRGGGTSPAPPLRRPPRRRRGRGSRGDGWGVLVK